jgi:hypothetical protein
MTHTPPPHPRTDDPLIDWVPGIPPVGLTVWRTPACDGAGSISDRLAYRLVAAYTNPGDLIIDLTGALAGVAATGGRTPIPAVFTGTRLRTTPILTAIAPGAKRPPRVVRGAEPPGLRDWFGDDLHDPEQSATATAPAIWPLASLLVAAWPLDPDPGTAAARLTELTTAATRLLEPGGCAVFAADRHGGGDYTALVTAARAAGLRYFQHIAAITADIDGDQLIYNATSRDLATTGDGTHIPVHVDLIIFTRPGGHPDD